MNPALDLVEPGSVGRHEVEMVARSLRNPSVNLGMLVGRIVVGHQVEFFGNVAEALEEILMALLAGGDDLSDVERGEQRGGAVVALDIADPEGRLGTVEGLNLRFLVDAQHRRVFQRAEVQSDEHFLDEERVCRQLERLAQVGLDAEQLEPALDGALREAGMAGHERSSASRSSAEGRS